MEWSSMDGFYWLTWSWLNKWYRLELNQLRWKPSGDTWRGLMRRPAFLFGCKIRPGITRISFGEKQISGGFPLRDARFKRAFRKCGEKSETSEHKQNFGNKTAGRGKLKRGLVCRSRFFTALPKMTDGSMWHISEPSSTSSFSWKELAGRSFVTIQCGWRV